MRMPTIEPEPGMQPASGGGVEAPEAAEQAQEALYKAEDKAINAAEKVGWWGMKLWKPVQDWKQRMVDKLNTPPE